MTTLLPEGSKAKGVVALAAVAVLLVLAWTVRVNLGERAEVQRLEQMRERLGDLRTEVDDCRLELAREEDAFNRFDARVDSLRELIADFEALDPRGVPGDRYEEYIESFERYNESVPRWQAQADSLQAHLATCRELARRHNLLADSLRTLLDERQEERQGG